MTGDDKSANIGMVNILLVYLLVRLVEPVRVEEEPRLESRLRWPVGEVTDEVVVVVGAEEVEVVEELRSSCLLPKEPLEDKVSDTAESPVRRGGGTKCERVTSRGTLSPRRPDSNASSHIFCHHMEHRTHGQRCSGQDRWV